MSTIMKFKKNVHVNKLEMLYYNKIDASGGVNVNKTSVLFATIGIF